MFTALNYHKNVRLLNQFMTWLLGLYDNLGNSSDTIIKGFKDGCNGSVTGTKDALVMKIPLEDPFADLDA